jgi:phosphonate transport system substrate-binding protein
MRVPLKKLFRAVLLVSVLLPLFLGMSCKSQEETVAVSDTDTPQQQTFLIGLIPEHNIFRQKKRYEPLAAYLTKKTGLKVELAILPRYGNIVENFTAKGLDGAFFGSFTGALAHKKMNLDALARPEWSNGVSSYYGLIFVRKDSGIRNVNDMKGKRFAFVDKATTAGWLLPLYYFKTNGIEDYRTFLQEVYFTGTHEGAIYDVLDKNADIGAAKNTVFDRLALKDKRISQELLILTRSPNVPANGLCVRKDLDDTLKTKLKETLLNMDQDAEGKKVLKDFGALRFIATTEADFAPVYEYAAQIGLDLTTYEYMND